MFITRLLHKAIRYPVQLRENYKKRKLYKKINQKLGKYMEANRSIN